MSECVRHSYTHIFLRSPPNTSFRDNCHSHVARCLNEMEYMGRTDWSMVGVGALVILNGKWVSLSHALCVWVPFLAVLAIILYFSLTK